MTTAEIRMNAVEAVKAYKIALRVYDNSFSEDISYCCPYVRGIHIYNGIRKLAEILGVEDVYTEQIDEDAPDYRICFKFDGVMFYQLGEDDERGR